MAARSVKKRPSDGGAGKGGGSGNAGKPADGVGAKKGVDSHPSKKFVMKFR